ncbi:MAG: aminomethyl transferase family protein [Solirubrobacterales bacterium]|nr:aminomethyl transferase family protein [Solirubrobacterales bacterium]
MATNELQQTAFDEAQRQAGATWTDWEGWAWAADFGDPVAEHHATRKACNLWDESPLRKWDMKGPDALALADVLYTNDMAALEVGQVRYGALCDEQGHMIMDGTIFKYAEDHCFSITSYDSDLDWYKQVAADRGLDVELRDLTAEMPHLQVQGPKVREILGPITEGVDIATLRYFRFVPEGVTIGGVPCMLSRTGYSGELGYELYCAPGRATDLWNAIVEAGTPHGLLPIGLSAIETLRIESGLLFPDIDYFPHVTDPFEARLTNVVKVDKPGDFIGKEALREIAAKGTARLLSGLRISGDELPEAEAPVLHQGVEVGVVRSPCQSPTFDMEVIAMATVDRELSVEGQELEVALPSGTAKATVGTFPLYDPEKKRPRA